MIRKHSNNQKRLTRSRRVRAKIVGTAERPRVTVFRSLRSFAAQVIDDTAGKTLLAVRLADVKGATNSVSGAQALGKLLGEKCKQANVTSVLFDRSGYRYHGKVRAFAEGAREAGLNF